MERLQIYSRSQFPPGAYVIGDQLAVTSPDGVYMLGRIIALDDKTITLDFSEEEADDQ